METGIDMHVDQIMEEILECSLQHVAHVLLAAGAVSTPGARCAWLIITLWWRWWWRGRLQQWRQGRVVVVLVAKA
jgi:hypothetical protein